MRVQACMFVVLTIDGSHLFKGCGQLQCADSLRCSGDNGRCTALCYHIYLNYFNESIQVNHFHYFNYSLATVVVAGLF